MRARWILAAVLVLPLSSRGYSVLTREAIIDSAWDDTITPLLKKRFPAITADQLIEAHSYAYGGAIIQDMGYYPFGRKLFSDLAHYEELFMASFNDIVVRYREFLHDVSASRLRLADRNFDTGGVTKHGTYGLADRAYERLLEKLSEKKGTLPLPSSRGFSNSMADQNQLAPKTLVVSLTHCANESQFK